MGDPQGILSTKFQNSDPREFYDIIIDIDSFENLRKTNEKETDFGWNVSYNEKEENGKKFIKGFGNYLKFRDQKIPVVSVIGTRNKGKTFLLSKLSKYTLPEGTSIKTRGISMKYPPAEKNAYLVIDTAGLDTPLCSLDKEVGKITEEKVQKVARDKQIIELFLDNFILNSSNVVIVLVGQLNLSEQKMLTKLKKIAKKKKILVVHNLFNLITKEQVENYISDVLKKSLTFKLEERKFTTFGKEPKKEEEEKSKEEEIEESKEETKEEENYDKYFYEIIENEQNQQLEIIHLVIANQNHLGSYYNEPVYKFIRTFIATVPKKKFDVFTELKNHIIQRSVHVMEKPIQDAYLKIQNKIVKIKKEVLEQNKEEIKEVEILECTEEDEGNKKEEEEKENKFEVKTLKEEIKKEEEKEINEEQKIKEIIITKQTQLIEKIFINEDFQLKKCMIDELGMAKFTGESFQPNYSYYMDNTNFVIEIELPGPKKNYEDLNLKCEKGELTKLQFTGNKIEDNDDNKAKSNQYGTFKSGRFELNISLKTDVVGIITVPKENELNKEIIEGIWKIELDRIANDDDNEEENIEFN